LLTRSAYKRAERANNEFVKSDLHDVMAMLRDV
jgi:hypothetical protein